jgi:hypothetical protein
LLEVGDLLRVGATGGRVDEGKCLVCLGAFRTGFLPQTGAFIHHSGPPTAVFFRAIEPGTARITLFTGDPYHDRSAVAVKIDVRPLS